MPITIANHEACIARIVARGSISQKEAENLLELVSEESDRLKRSGVDNPIAQAAFGLAQDLKQVALERQADAIRNGTTRDARIDHATKGATTIKGAIDRLIGTLIPTVGKEASGKLNVETLARTLTHNWLSVMHAGLQKDGLLKFAGNPQNFRQIAIAVEAIRNGRDPASAPLRAAEGGTSAGTGATGKVARVIVDIQNAMRGRLNAEGARIADAKDWTATTSHDPIFLRRGGRGQDPTPEWEDAFNRWRDYVLPRLDEKTFDGVQPVDGQTIQEARNGFLRRVFAALETGVHMRLGGTDAPTNVGPAFEGTYNIARKISQARTLFWRDAGSWSDYMARYGNAQDWYSLVTKAAEGNGRRAALMNMWGTNPAANLNLVVKRIGEMFRDKDPDGTTAFMKHASGSRLGLNINTLMKYLDGTASRPENEMAAKLGSTVRGLMNMTYLGFVALTHASSLVSTAPTTARFFGKDALSTIGNVIAGQFRSLNAADRRELAAQLGSYGEGAAREAANYFGPGYNYRDYGGFPGVVAAAQNRYMAATGLPYVVEHTKAAFREMVANSLARWINKPFDTLERHLQNTLRGYGIGPDEWALLRNGEMTKAGGRSYLTAANPQSIPADALEAHLRSQGALADTSTPDVVNARVARLRSDLSDRLAMMYQDAGDQAIVTPGIRERALLGRDRPGSWRNELFSMATQFKSWPVAAFHQLAARQFYEGLSGRDTAYGVGTLIGLTMLGGYIRNTLRDVLNGEEPQPIRNPGEAAKVGAAAIAQGGGLGILGDALFGELNRFGASNETSFIGGPIGTTIDRLAIEPYRKYMQSLGTDRPYDPWPEIGRAALGSIPLSNLIYLRGGLNYLALWHAYESLKPGWWQRTNEMMQRQQGRHMIGYRPYAPVPYSPWG